MNAGLRRRVAHHADGFARTFSGPCVGLCPLSAHRKAAQMAHASITLDTLKPFLIHADLATQVAFDDVLPILNCVHDL